MKLNVDRTTVFHYYFDPVLYRLRHPSSSACFSLSLFLFLEFSFFDIYIYILRILYFLRMHFRNSLHLDYFLTCKNIIKNL